MLNVRTVLNRRFHHDLRALHTGVHTLDYVVASARALPSALGVSASDRKVSDGRLGGYMGWMEPPKNLDKNRAVRLAAHAPPSSMPHFDQAPSTLRLAVRLLCEHEQPVQHTTGTY